MPEGENLGRRVWGVPWVASAVRDALTMICP